MLKGAIVIVAFSFFLLSCQAKTVYLPPTQSIPPSVSLPAEETPLSQPGLEISDISLDETGKVIIFLSNIRKDPLLHQTGNLKIYTDDDLKWNICLQDITDRAFLEPGGTTRYTTPVELEGTHSVRAIIDYGEKRTEGDSVSNPIMRVLSFPNPARLPSPLSVEPETLEEVHLYTDIALLSLSLDPQGKLVVHLSNDGNTSFPLQEATLQVFVDNVSRGSYSLGELSDTSMLLPEEEMAFAIPLTLVGRHEVSVHLDMGPGMNEWDRGKRILTKMFEGLPEGPDIFVKELALTEDFELSICLSNAGERELRKKTILRVRIFINDQKVSEFEHLTTEPLRPHSGNCYEVEPPYHVGISGNAKVRVAVLARLAADDVRRENNTLERNFMIVPFRIDSQSSQEFPFLPSSPRRNASVNGDKVQTEVRWDGGGSPLRLSLRRGKEFKRIAPVSGKSPLKLEIPMEPEKDTKGDPWRLLVTNLMETRAEGSLILQFP